MNMNKLLLAIFLLISLQGFSQIRKDTAYKYTRIKGENYQLIYYFSLDNYVRPTTTTQKLHPGVDMPSRLYPAVISIYIKKAYGYVLIKQSMKGTFSRDNCDQDDPDQWVKKALTK
jgi:hypothetical protein